MTGWSGHSPLRRAWVLGSFSVHAFVLPLFCPEEAFAALVNEKHLKHPELLPFVPLLWKNEGLLFADVLLQKLLLPFGLTSPYTNLFMTEAVRDIAANIAAVKAESAPRRLRGRRLQQDEGTAKDTLRSFVRSVHAALRGNTFDITFADELIKHLPVGISGQIASITESVGKEVLRILTDADNPASAIVTHLLGPLDGGEVPLFELGGSEGISGEENKASRRLQHTQRSATGQREMDKQVWEIPLEDDNKRKATRVTIPVEPKDDQSTGDRMNSTVNISEGGR